MGPKIKMRHKTVPNYMPARGQDIGLSRNTFGKKDGIWILCYYTRNLAYISVDISGTAEFLRTSDFGVVYTKYRLAFHGKQDVLGSLGHFRNG